jgi:hypothetical protein
MDWNDRTQGPSSEDLLEQFREGLAAAPEESPEKEPPPRPALTPLDETKPADPWGGGATTPPASTPDPSPAEVTVRPPGGSPTIRPARPASASDPTPRPEPPPITAEPPQDQYAGPATTPSSYDEDTFDRPAWEQPEMTPERLEYSSEPPIVGTTVGALLKRGIGLGVGILIALGVFMFLNRGPHIDSLVTGDCFQEPSNTENVTNVDEVACVEPHDYEVFAVIEHPAAQSVPYPGDLTLLEWSDERCFAEFEPYVGASYDQSIYYYDIAIPTEESWDNGDRGSTCILYQSPDSGFSVSRASGSARSSFR